MVDPQPRAASGRPTNEDELARLSNELRYQRDLLARITDNASVALFLMDRDGYPIFMNAAACAMTGYSGVEEIRDRPLHYAVHHKRPDGSPYPMEECPIDRANAEIRAVKDQPEVWCRKDGSLFHVRYNVAPVERDGERLGVVIEVRDVTREMLHEAERAQLLRDAEAARERLHLLFVHAPAAIAIVDGPDFVFAFVNRHYEELVGRKAADLVSRPVREALPEVVEQGFLELLEGVRTSGEPFQANGMPVTLHRDGRPVTIYVNFVYQPVPGPDGRITSIMAHAIDVTTQVQAERQLKELATALEERVQARTAELTSANRELRQANEVLESFASVISHDLKEPVRGIENYLAATLEEMRTDAAREYVQEALEANRRQAALIQGLLAYSRASFGPLHDEAVNLTALVRDESRGYYEQQARERGAVVEVEELPRVRGHGVLLTQAFGNLILNAIRHNPSPHPRVRVHARAEGSDVVVLIDDNGGGFPPEVVRQLEATTTARQSTIKGGFGLAISNRAIQRMGGRMWVGASPEGGGRVHVQLPAA